MEMPTLVRAIEAILYVSADPVTLKRLEQIFAPEEVERAALREALDVLRRNYSGRGVELQEISGGYQMRTGSDLGEYLSRLDMPRAFRLSQAALETLSIVAYRQPVTRADVEQVRGVDGGAVMRTMLDRGLVKVVGKKDVPGRPLLYGTTKKFLEVFGLSSLTDLPTLRQIEDLTAEPEEEAQEAGKAEPDEPQLPFGDNVALQPAPPQIDAEGLEQVAVEQASLERDAREELGEPAVKDIDEDEG